MIVCVVLIRENAENFMDYIYIAYFCGTIYMFSLLLQIDRYKVLASFCSS